MARLIKIVLPLIGKFRFFSLIVLGLVTGLGNFFFISNLTKIIGLITTGTYKSVSNKYIVLFLTIIFFIVLTRKLLAQAIITISQTIFWGLRKQIISIVLTADYRDLVNKRNKIQATLMGDVYVLTDAAMSIIGFSTAGIIAISCSVYLASLSMTLFLVTVFFALIGVSIYWLNSVRYNRLFEKARVEENKFVHGLFDILEGFKEIFMEPKKGRHIFEKRIESVAKESYKHATAAQIGFLNNQITGQILFYLLVTTILLILSVKVKIQIGDMVSFIFSLFYLLGSIETIMVMLPNLMRATVSANHLMDLKSDLEKSGFKNQAPQKYIGKDDFRQITVSDLEFRYGEEQNDFGIGPMDFEILRGEVVFIYGENGSGKTTFIQAILGLLIPTGGSIRLNNVVVSEKRYNEYRTLFAVVFSDFFLFSEVLGVDNLNMEKWDYYIDLFELKGKVSLENKILSTTNLSTGQRKRLALICALMEEKPVIVLDEWAADQDPYFRKKFYSEIISILKAEGFTIIAITHDDKYYHYADKHYRMNFGKLIRHSEPLFSQIN